MAAILQMTFLNVVSWENNVYILIKVSLKFVLYGPIDNK